MKLVEVIAGASSSPETLHIVTEFVLKLGKQAVMARDVPGFIVNRVARHFYLESLKTAAEAGGELPLKESTNSCVAVGLRWDMWNQWT